MSNNGTEDGFAVPLAVGLLALLSLICVQMLIEVKAMRRSETSEALVARARYAADGGIYRAIFALTSASDPLFVPLDGSPVELAVGDEHVVVRATSESAKIDINHASKDTLIALFRSTGMKESDAVNLANRVVAWRNHGSEGSGAETATYASSGRPYSPSFEPFATTREMNLVLGMTDEMAVKIIDFVTVWSRDGFVDRSLASAIVLQALAATGDSLAEAELDARRAPGPRSNARRAVPGETVTLSASVSDDRRSINRRAIVTLRWESARPFDILSLQ